MGKKENEMEFSNLIEQYKAEAMKNAVNAFNEGYLLGRRHAEEVLGGRSKDEN